MAEQLEAVVRAPKKDDTHFPPDIRAKAEQLSYFHVDRPSNAIDGIANSEYNFIKGAVAGPVMLVTAPFIGASEEMKGKQVSHHIFNFIFISNFCCYLFLFIVVYVYL